MSLPNSNFGYTTQIDGECLEQWSNSDYEHYYEKNNKGKYSLCRRNRTTPKKLDYSIRSDKERLQILYNLFGEPNEKISSTQINQKPYTFFDKYFDNDKQGYKVNINSKDDLSEKIDVCKLLEIYADYLLFAPDADPLYKKTKYTIITEKQSKEISKHEQSYEEIFENLSENYHCTNKKYISKKCKKYLHEKIDDEPFMYFVDRKPNFYLDNRQKIYKKDLDDNEIGDYIKNIYNIIVKLKQCDTFKSKDKLIVDQMIGDLRLHAIDYKNGIKQPIKFKRLSECSTKIDWFKCDYGDLNQIKEILRCPHKDLLNGLGEIVYDVWELIKKINIDNGFTEQELKILKLWANTNNEESDGDSQQEIAKQLNCSQQFISQSLNNICNKIINEYNDKCFDNWYLSLCRVTCHKPKYKICSKCKKKKLIYKFGKDERNKDGLQSLCRKCDSIRKK